jgi:hypothetical protein
VQNAVGDTERKELPILRRKDKDILTKVEEIGGESLPNLYRRAKLRPVVVFGLTQVRSSEKIHELIVRGTSFTRRYCVEGQI